MEQYAATGLAQAVAKYYETTGSLKDPLVTLHTLADPVVPYWQEPLYAAKAFVSQVSPNTALTVAATFARFFPLSGVIEHLILSDGGLEKLK